MATQRRREYLQLLDAAKSAIELAVDCFNRVHNPYRNESTLMLIANAWELLAKAVLVQKHQSIRRGRRGETIGPEIAVVRLRDLKLLDASQAQTIQQVISLRHAAVHHVLPPVADEIMHHLLFFACKFFRETVRTVFPAHAKDLPASFLSLSFVDLTTYADKVQKSISRVRRSPADRRLVWLLERGVAFDGSTYLTEKQVEAKYKGKNKISPHLELGEFVRQADMVRIVPVEAPKNFTADITLRKGSTRDSTLPVVVKKTELEVDYPYLTREVAEKIGRNQNWTAKAATVLKLKGDPKYHQAIRVSRSSVVQRYSDAALQRLQSHIAENPTFNPYA
ncbi:MAG: hypothetical protein P1T08_16580 [Acidimicrobiia bacterium]|nr:hypothetical protein [Acidimicrobiia bacterium]